MNLAFVVDLFLRSNHTQMSARQRLPPAVIGLVVGLVDPASVDCHWVKQFELLLPTQCGSTYNFLSRPVPEIHKHVAGKLSNQHTTAKTG